MKKNLILTLLVFTLSACSNDEIYKDEYTLYYKNELVKVYFNEDLVDFTKIHITRPIYEDDSYIYILEETTYANIIVLYEEEEYKLDQAFENEWLDIDEILDLSFNEYKIISTPKD